MEAARVSARWPGDVADKRASRPAFDNELVDAAGRRAVVTLVQADVRCALPPDASCQTRPCASS